MKVTANLIKQYQLIKSEIVQREAHKRFVGDLDHFAPLPPGPWTISQLGGENDMADPNRFYSRVHANVVDILL